VNVKNLFSTIQRLQSDRNAGPLQATFDLKIILNSGKCLFKTGSGILSGFAFVAILGVMSRFILNIHFRERNTIVSFASTKYAYRESTA
jgi:hypothetical protein